MASIKIAAWKIEEPMPTYGVIDLGSNSIRLVVYEIRDDRKRFYTNKDFKSVINNKLMAGLSAFAIDEVFTEVGIHRAIGVVKGHLKRAQYFNCKRIDVFATAVLRNVKNSSAALGAIEEGIGLPITLLSARDEAHLGFVGATCDRTIERGTLVDIGGGSSELTRIVGGRDYDHTSIGQGSLSSYAAYVHAILPTPTEMETITATFRERLMQLAEPQAYRAAVFYGIGGSVRATSKMYAQIHERHVRPKEMTLEEIRTILDRFRIDPSTFAHDALKASAERIHTLIPGCLILQTLLEELGGRQVEICKYGVREGYLIERMLHQ